MPAYSTTSNKLYADDTAVIATSRKPTLLVSYLESYLSDLEPWLIEWKVAINVSKSTAMLFTLRGIQKFAQLYCLGNQPYGSIDPVI